MSTSDRRPGRRTVPRGAARRARRRRERASSPAAGASSATAMSPESARRCSSVSVSGEPSHLRYFQGRNEQAMVHASVAYARQRDRLAAMAVTASVGPGATNMVTGAALATINRLPVLLLPGDTFATKVANPVLQELEDPANGDMSRQRRVPSGVGLLRPGAPSRAARAGAAQRDAGAHRSRPRPAP